MSAAAPPTTPRAVRTATAGRTTAWREPTYVLLFVAGVFADMINGNAKYVGFPISPDRLLFAGAVVLVLTDADARRQVRLRWRVVHTMMVATLAWVFWSGLTAGTIDTTFGLYAWLDRLAMPFLVFTLAPVVLCTPRRRDLLLKALTVMGIYLGLTAVFEVIGPHALVFPRYIMNPALGIHFGYARGPFLEAEANGLVMTGCGLCAGLLATRAIGRWRTAAFVAVPLCVVGGFLAQERSVWIGQGLAILSVSLLVPRLRRLLPATIALIAVAVAVAFAASPALRKEISGRTTYSASVYDRRNTDAAAIRIIESHPLTGLGWVTFVTHGQAYVRLSPDYPITNVNIEVHNVYLSRAAETGVPGGALFVACLLAGPVRAGLRRWKPGLGTPSRTTGAGPDDDRIGWHLISLGFSLAWFTCSMLSPLPYPLANLMVWLFAGIVLAPWLTDGSPTPAGALTADGELSVRASAAA